MTTTTRRTGRRADGLSKDRIVEAAIDILDTGGENALTFRSLAARLTTGSGAIYHHVANKDELLAAATDAIIARVVTEMAEADTPRQTIRTLALGVFDAIDAHPWAGAQLSREPWQSGMLRILEGMGAQLQALGVPEHAQFDCATALVNCVLGLAGQYAAGARLVPPDTDRAAFLATVAAEWTRLDADQYPFVHRIAAQLRDHDDREQFLAGIDLILGGIDTLNRKP
ncbi:TetR/AcrR family transcriptional regulator [Nocardia sp. CDC160]|uniref:TetR/AcrR family transcriptional regulator n=1 Tax=Nocardia sp. CDC160 TaxID=3112166 RepID=UPI002DBB5244|nr:helix-turn-helix domain-containing protein [Nocardia sp. CDC160]MEC3917447.1 helix-turn-helix domain-containing protein [Nocardia sp. CDC160]